MAKWNFESGHTAAEFCVRHMMVTYVRGHFKNVHGTLVFDPANPQASSVEAVIDASALWTGESDRDNHLRSADFLDAENHPTITFSGDQVEVLGDHDYNVTGNLTIRGMSRPATLKVSYLGQWQTPWWEDGELERPARPGRHCRKQRGRDHDRCGGDPRVPLDRKSTRLNSSHSRASRMPSSA